MEFIQVWTRHATTREVRAEIEQRYGVGPELSDGAALAIASWWQSPGAVGHAFASLASGAPVEYLALRDDIVNTLAEHEKLREES